jgi:ribosomal protein S18 acetylase RimI-like enzyme
MSKINMKHTGNRPDIKYPCEPIENYSEYQKVLLGAGYKKWVRGKITKLAVQYIPRTWLGVRVGQKLVGVCSAEFGAIRGYKQIHSARIAALAVLPKFRGNGIATSIVAAVVRELQELGYKNIYVNVHKENGAAVRVYKKAGFRKI